MPVGGLAITLSNDPALAQQAIDQLAGDSRIELGIRQHNKLPIVTDTPSQKDDRALLEWINSLHGVSFVDITFIHFDDDSAPAGIDNINRGAL